MSGEDASGVLALRWAFGFSREAGVHNLCDENRSALFYASAHTGVIYDLNTKKQRLLQARCARACHLSPPQPMWKGAFRRTL